MATHFALTDGLKLRISLLSRFFTSLSAIKWLIEAGYTPVWFIVPNRDTQCTKAIIHLSFGK